MVRTLALLAAFLMLPVAAAAPVEATLEDAREPRVAGAVRAWTEAGALNLTSAAQAGAPFLLGFTDLEGVRVRVETHRVGDHQWALHPPSTEQLPSAGGDVRIVRCGPECGVYLVAEGRGRVGAEGEWAGTPDWARLPGRLCAERSCNDRAPYWAHPVEAGSWLLATEGTMLRPMAEGRVRLVVRDAIVAWTTPDGPRSLDLLTRAEALAPSLVREEHRFLVATLDGARLVAPEGTDAGLHAETLRVDVQGVFSTPGATGAVEYLGERTRLRDEPLDVRGALALTLEGGAAGAALATPPHGAGTLEGDASSLRAGARAAVAPREAQADAALLVGLAALLALLALLVPAYSRISRARVMTNANRALVHDVLTSAPGRTVPEVSRATGLATVVVRHHLAILLAHGVVVRRADGRLRRYYPVGQVPPPHAIAREGALADATRRAVAEAVAAFPEGATQRQLMERTGLSQRLVSYHLARLRDAGLVREEAGLPKRYRSMASNPGA